jgi:transposase-like protein
VRAAGVIFSRTVLVAVAVDADGRRQILAVELANRESRSSWRDFLSGLKARGLAGVEFIVSDNYEGLKLTIREVLPEAAWQRCYVHFVSNALGCVPRKSLPSRKRGWMTIACGSCAGIEDLLLPLPVEENGRQLVEEHVGADFLRAHGYGQRHRVLR